jgi:hypothetical protein
MMERVFPASQWPALRTLWQKESGWRTNADNPTSDAYGIPQSLPGSKMASAGSDWKSNPATQIRWGLRYIKGRYGSPSKALAFHRANNWYAKGGFVASLVQRFAQGGTVKKIAAAVGVQPPRGAKKPSRKKAGRGSGDVIKLKPFKVRGGATFTEAPAQKHFDTVWNRTLPPLNEDYEEFTEDADLVQEEFLVDAPGGGQQTVDWAAVTIRIAELDGLLKRAAAIQDKIVVARDIALQMIDQLKNIIKGQVEQASSVLQRLRNNVHRLKQLRTHLMNEKGKKGKNRDQGAINYIQNLIAAIETQNQELGGTRDTVPANWTSLESGTVLGDIATVIRDASVGLDPDGDGASGKLIEIQGRTGRSGLLDTIGDDIRKWTAEKLDLQPGGKLVTPAKADAQAAQETASADIRSFINSLAQLHKDFSPNFRVLGMRHIGGPVWNSGLYQLQRGEIVVNPNLPSSTDNSRQVTIVNNYESQPQDPHLWSRNMEFEMRTAV